MIINFQLDGLQLPAHIQTNDSEKYFLAFTNRNDAIDHVGNIKILFLRLFGLDRSDADDHDIITYIVVTKFYQEAYTDEAAEYRSAWPYTDSKEKVERAIAVISDLCAMSIDDRAKLANEWKQEYKSHQALAQF